MENVDSIFWLAPLSSILALVFAYWFYKQMMKEDEGTSLMRKIAKHVRDGAMAYIRQQYKVVAIFFVILAILLGVLAYVGLQNGWVPFAFLTGGFFSALAGYFGMKTATHAAARTTQAARSSLDKGLKIAFRSGAVMGLVVVGLGLLDITFWFILLNFFTPAELTVTQKLVFITTTMLTFEMGASTQALFARLGGGIYTKAADVGADLVGKVEAGIPEDDPRNPATIADNVGDNVGDIAGMGADLFESYVNSIIAAMAIGLTIFGGQGILFPLMLAAIGIVSSIIGVYFVKVKEGGNAQVALRIGTFVTGGLMIAGSFVLTKAIFNELNLFWGVLSGVAVGVLIGFITEIYTSSAYKPVQQIAASTETGYATTILSGIAVGMKSTVIPVLLICTAILVSYFFSGLYGIACAAVGMLSITGMSLSVDAYGPIADNAGGIAEMSDLDPEVRKITDKLDAVGNTTAAMGKGLAIGSAALTALALFAAYAQAVELAVIDLNNPKVMVGLFIGGMLPFLFSALTIQAVGRSAQSMIDEVRRQFREISGILEGTGRPEYEKCVDISTAAALKEMVIPGLLAVVMPIVIGYGLGAEALGGLLGGSITTGVMLAIFMSNAGGAWDNAKKYIEEGHHGGKGTENHAASVVGDTVGDPFKDTSGPSLNILIKLMSVVALVIAPLLI